MSNFGVKQHTFCGRSMVDKHIAAFEDLMRNVSKHEHANFTTYPSGNILNSDDDLAELFSFAETLKKQFLRDQVSESRQKCAILRKASWRKAEENYSSMWPENVRTSRSYLEVPKHGGADQGDSCKRRALCQACRRLRMQMTSGCCTPVIKQICFRCVFKEICVGG